MKLSKFTPPLHHYTIAIKHQDYSTAIMCLKQATEHLFQTGQAHQVIELAQQIPISEQQDAELHICLGDAWRLHNNWLQANSAYHTAEYLAINQNQSVIHAQALARQALVCWLRGDSDGSVTRYQQAFAIFNTLAQPEPLQTEAEHGYALALSYQGNVVEAMNILQNQIRLAQRNHDVNSQWMGLNNLAMLVYLRQGCYDLADATIQEAQAIAEYANHRYGLAYLANTSTYIALYAQDTYQAVTRAKTALNLADSVNIPNISAFALINQAHVCVQQQQFEQGLQYCQQALTQLASPSSSTLYSDLWLIQGQCKSEPRLIQQAIDHARDSGDRWMIAQCLLGYAQYLPHHKATPILREVTHLMGLYQPNWQPPSWEVTPPTFRLKLETFGHFRVWINNDLISNDQWKTQQSKILLLYLSLYQRISREQLIEILWSDQPIAKTSSRLRTTVKLLRQTLNQINDTIEWINYRLHTYSINPIVTIESDIAQFHHLVNQAKTHSDLIQAYALCKIIHNYAVETWMMNFLNDAIINYRKYLVRNWLWASETCLRHAINQRALEEATSFAQAIIQVDEWNELAQQYLTQYD